MVNGIGNACLEVKAVVSSALVNIHGTPMYSVASIRLRSGEYLIEYDEKDMGVLCISYLPKVETPTLLQNLQVDRRSPPHTL